MNNLTHLDNNKFRESLEIKLAGDNILIFLNNSSDGVLARVFADPGLKPGHLSREMRRECRGIRLWLESRRAEAEDHPFLLHKARTHRRAAPLCLFALLYGLFS